MFGLANHATSYPRYKDITAALCYIAHTTQFPRQRALLDLKLEPPCSDIGLLDYHRKDEIIQRGFDYALPLLQDFVHASKQKSKSRKEEILFDKNRQDASSATSKVVAGRRMSLPSAMPQMLKTSRRGGTRPMWSDALDSEDVAHNALADDLLEGRDSSTKLKTSLERSWGSGPELLDKHTKLHFDLLSETFKRERYSNHTQSLDVSDAAPGQNTPRRTLSWDSCQDALAGADDGFGKGKREVYED
jgi:hypothetical protein